MEPRAADEWFHCKVLNILWRHFYVLYECRPWKIVVDLFFTITFIFFFFTKNQNQKKKNGTAWILSQTIALDQSAREDSLSYCKKYNGAQSQNDENTL